MAVLLDSYSEINADVSAVIGAVHPSGYIIPSAWGQSFTVPADKNYKITSAKFYLRKTGSPIGNLVARLYAITGTPGVDAKPTGSVLAESNAVVMVSLTGVNTLIEFTFPSGQQYEMMKGVHYCIECVAKNATVLDGFTNYPKINLDHSAPTHSGNTSYFANEIWKSSTSHDTCFYVYGAPIGPVCSDYKTKETCEAAGCFWYDGACHSTAKGKGIVNVYAVADSEEVTASFMVNGQGPYDTPKPLDLDPATYTIIGNYKGQTDKQTVKIEAGDVKNITLTFTKMHDVTITSDPTPIDFTFNEEKKSTPFKQPLTSGTYTLVFPASWMVGVDEYIFTQWENGSVNRRRTLILGSPEAVNLVVTYRLKQVEGTGPITQREMKDTLRQVIGQEEDISEKNPLQVYDPKTEGEVKAVQEKLDDPTSGLEKIKAEVANIETAVAPANGTTTADGNPGGTTVIDTTRTEPNDHWNTMTLLITSGAQNGQVREITDWVLATGTFTVAPAFGGQILTDVTYKILTNLPADIDIAAIEAKLDDGVSGLVALLAAINTRAVPGDAMALTPAERLVVQALIINDLTPFAGADIAAILADTATIAWGDITAIKTETDQLPNVEHETEWAAICHCNEVETLEATNLTVGAITPTFPTGSTRVRALLIASIHILNLAANTHHINFKVEGNKDGGAYSDLLDLTATAQLGLVNLDGATEAWAAAIDVTTLVDASGSTYNFRFVVTSDNAGAVRYITCFTLVLVYTM